MNIFESINKVLLEDLCINEELDEYKDFKSSNEYLFARGNIYSPDKLKWHLSTIFYANNKTGEQDAMINGLWGDLKMNGSYVLIDKIFKESEAYAWLSRLNDAVEFLSDNENNKDIRDSYLRLAKEKGFKYSYKQVLNYGKLAIDKFERKISRVIYRFKKRFLNEENVRVYFSAKRNTNPYLLRDYPEDLIYEAEKMVRNRRKVI